MSTRIIVIFNLREGVSPQEYENWARSTDLPTVRQLGSVEGFEVLRATGLLGSDQPSPYQYAEVLDVRDMEALGADVSTERMQQVSAEFQQWADNPVFIVTERL